MMFSTIEDAWSSKNFQIPHSCASSNLSNLVECPHCREKLSSLLHPERRRYNTLFEGFGGISDQVNNVLLVMVVIVLFKILHIL